MRKYETVFISDPDLSDQARTELFDKVRNIIANEKGVLLDFDEWGNKKLAYEIKKKLRGHYICATYGGNGELVKELERNFRLTDDVLKFMTIVLSEDMPAAEFEKQAQELQEPEEAVAEAAQEETTDTQAAPEEDDAASDDKAEAAVETEEKTE